MSIFDGITFLVVDAETDDHYTVQWMQNIIARNGGRHITRKAPNTGGSIEKNGVTHIISATYNFAEYGRACELMVPVTSPQWLEDLQLAGQRRNYRLYSPVPLPFMDRVVVCIADNLPEGDREMLYSGVRAFGGQYLDALSRYTTHLVAVDLSNNKSVVAANIKKKEGLHIRIVLPQWVDACIKQQRHVDETPYLLQDPIVLQTGKPNMEAEFEQAPHNGVLDSKSVYLHNDYRLSEHVVDALSELVSSCGGILTTEYSSDADIYIGKYRDGECFRASFAAGHVVASLPWLYYVSMRKQYVDPLSSQLLHFPVPKGIVPEFQNLRISVTGYSGDARHYLCQLIVAMGATFTKTLDSQNDFLVSSKSSGEKYDAVKSRWPSVVLVNHLWVEDCFAAWSYLDPVASRYSNVESTQILGKTHLKSQDLLRWTQEGSAALDVDDSVNEDHATDHNISDHQVNPEKQLSTTQSPLSSPNASPSPAPKADTKSPNTSVTSGIEDVHEVIDVPTQAPRAGRSAKLKAERKLHSDMEDLNQYTSMSKSARKMKTYMEELDKSATAKRDSLASTPEPKKAKTEKKAEKKKDVDVHMVAIMTGCEQDLVLTRAEVVKLAKVGIHIVNDTSKRPVDTIIAPRVLRTEKFLISLSKASQIVHPSYLVDVLNRLNHSESTWQQLSVEFNVKNYYLDKVVSVKQINEELGVKGTASGLQRLLLRENGLVFDGMQVNLSSNLNGGAGLIAGILEAHGLKNSKQIKLSASTSKANLLLNDGTYILIAHKVRDKKFAAQLEDVVAVDWDWCVRSIFHNKLQSYAKYIVGK